jgi:uncharacterized protein (DUF488 family)
VTTRLFTIGFAETPAEQFFEAIRRSGVRRVVDVRLNNTSQLAAYSKREDLRYFLRSICGVDYVHVPELAPTRDILEAYKKHKGSWAVYEQEFNALMTRRSIERNVPRELLDNGCLLCSEKKPHHCHRRLVAQYLARHWGDVTTTDLGC